jgi:hypothetical protein
MHIGYWSETEGKRPLGRSSSGVQVVMVKDSAAHCNAGFFSPKLDLCGATGC